MGFYRLTLHDFSMVVIIIILIIINVKHLARSATIGRLVPRWADRTVQSKSSTSSERVQHAVAPPGFFLWGGRKGPVKMLGWHWHNTCCMPKSNGRQYFLALPLILSGSI